MIDCSLCDDNRATHTEYAETGEGSTAPMDVCDDCCVHQLPEGNPARNSRTCTQRWSAENIYNSDEVTHSPTVKERLDKLKGLIDQMLDPFAPPPAQPTVRAFRSASYGFPEVVLEAGKEKSESVKVSGFFRGEKLLMSAVMDAVRGHYRIRHSRRGLLNRDDVFAFSEIKRRASKNKHGKISRSIPGRTVVSYQGKARSYLPENVVYIPTDPLEYIQLSQLYCGVAPAMAGGAEVPAQLFGMGSFGTILPLPSTKDASITILLRNVSDVQVRVRATILGYSR